MIYITSFFCSGRSKITDKYLFTLHIDNDSVLQIFSGSRVFRDLPLSGEAADWSKDVMAAVAELEKDREEAEKS